jgi:glycine hydroxymethyltransferase
VRLGTPAGTTRGFGPAEFRRIGQLIAEVVDGLAATARRATASVEAEVRDRGAGLDRPLPDLRAEKRGAPARP